MAVIMFFTLEQKDLIMLMQMSQFWQDDVGFIVSAELVLVATIGVLAVLVGLSEVATAVNEELNDFSNAIGALNQSYGVTGFQGTDSTSGTTTVKSGVAGSAFIDTPDLCDVGPIQLVNAAYGSIGG